MCVCLCVPYVSTCIYVCMHAFLIPANVRSKYAKHQEEGQYKVKVDHKLFQIYLGK